LPQELVTPSPSDDHRAEMAQPNSLSVWFLKRGIVPQ
jgi:hypothetical protein